MLGMLLLLMAWLALPPPSWVELIRHAAVTDRDGMIELAEQKVRQPERMGSNTDRQANLS